MQRLYRPRGAPPSGQYPIATALCPDTTLLLPICRFMPITYMDEGIIRVSGHKTKTWSGTD